MYRYAIEELKKWKSRKNRKPMILEGARQVGKTWLMKEFGATEFEDVAYINFDSNSQMRELFAGDLAVERIITGLELYVGKKINAEKTLLIFDDSPNNYSKIVCSVTSVSRAFRAFSTRPRRRAFSSS